MTAQLHTFPRPGAGAPPPMVPSDVDVRDADGFRFSISRMLRSDWARSCSREEHDAGVWLHAESIQQFPAGSLPNSDALLARLADYGRDIDGFLVVKSKALEGWTLCSDNRLYHPETARNALHIWIGRLEKRRLSALGNGTRTPDRDFGLALIDTSLESAAAALHGIDPQDAALRDLRSRMTKRRAAALKQNEPQESDSAAIPSGTPTGIPSGTPTGIPLAGCPKRSEAKRRESTSLSQSESEAGARDPTSDAEFARDGGPSPGEAPEKPPPWPPDAFDQFWRPYPHKIGRGQAERAFAAARKSAEISFDAILAALDRYVRCKPPDRAWCNPATWLNGKRWTDEWPAMPPLALDGHRRSRDESNGWAQAVRSRRIFDEGEPP